MNRKKMVDLAEQVMTEVDGELEKVLRHQLERRLCDRLQIVIGKAGNFVAQDYSGDASAESKKCYKMVKPVLDDCIDRLLGVPSKDE